MLVLANLSGVCVPSAREFVSHLGRFSRNCHQSRAVKSVTVTYFNMEVHIGSSVDVSVMCEFLDHLLEDLRSACVCKCALLGCAVRLVFRCAST